MYTFKFQMLHVPLAEETLSDVWDGVRVGAAVLTGGISTWFNGGLAPLTHAAVQFMCNCSKCQEKDISVLIDMGKDSEIQCRKGHYEKGTASDSVTVEKEDKFSLKDVLDHVSSKGEYNFVNHNCNHVAGQAYRAACALNDQE